MDPRVWIRIIKLWIRNNCTVGTGSPIEEALDGTCLLCADVGAAEGRGSGYPDGGRDGGLRHPQAAYITPLHFLPF
jgi:hypothetical protein